MLTFKHLHFLEKNYDFARVEISIDDGVSWQSEALAEYTGDLPVWRREYIDLSTHTSQANVKIRFRLITDVSVVMEGWFIDDVAIGEAPFPVVLEEPEVDDIQRNSVAIRWSESEAPDFAAYHVYRSRESGFTTTNATIIGEIASADETTFTDINCSPKTRYYYRVAVVNSADLAVLSNEITVLTPAGMDYPFYDDGEGGPNTWIATAPWALSDQYAYSATYAWADSPYGDYDNNIASQPLTLAAPVDLSSAETPIFSFVHRYNFASGDTGNVEISTNEGGSWTTLAAYGTGSADWQRERFDLSGYVGAPSILIRFRLTTDSVNTAEGWHIDDISLAEAPTVVPAPAIDEITSHTLRLTWATNSDAIFSHYAVHRSTSSNVGIQSPLAGTVADQNMPVFTDTGLALDTVYYYRVYAVSSYGTYSEASQETSSARTLNNPLPFFDDFSEGLQSWNVTGAWGLTATHSHGGQWSLTDSPDTMHHNNASSSATTAVDLRGNEWPVLSFAERFDFGAGDRGYVAVSTDGTNWTHLYSLSGQQTEWAETRIDLSSYRNQANLRIRFTLTANNDGNVGDGWYIDTVTVAEHGDGIQALPFIEDFAGGLDNWITGGWTTREYNEALRGGHVLADSANDDPWSDLYLHLGKELDLTEAVDPQVVFWYQGHWASRHYLRLQISDNKGLTWNDTGIVGGTNAITVAEWTRHQQSLAAYAGKTVRLRLRNYLLGSYGSTHTGRVDALTVQERPAAVTQETPVPSVRSASLSWSQSNLPDFARYEVYRHTSSNVTPAHTRVASITDGAQTSITDTGLSVGQTYVYSVFVVNTDEVYSNGAERQTTTVPVTFPYSDDMSSLNNWMPDGNWGIQTGGGMEGGDALASNPDGDYAPSEHTSTLTAVDLTGSSWPVLSFAERFDFGAGDRGYVAVSTDGTNWTHLYSLSGQQTEWAETRIDLSSYRNQANLRIRFTLTANNDGNVGDGWRIDTVTVAEHGDGIQALPFIEDFAGGLDNWITGGWTTREDNEALRGGHVLADSANDDPWSDLYLHLGKELDLTEAVDPQVVFWYQGHWASRHYLRLQISDNKGLTWNDTGIVGGTNAITVAEWTRHQQSLAAYAGKTVRLRLRNYLLGSYGSTHTGRVDALTVQEQPAIATLLPVPDFGVASISLEWQQPPVSDFASYRIYRHSGPNVTETSTLVAEINDPQETTFTDYGLQARTTYHYRVFTWNENSVSGGSNTVSATTLAVEIPWSEDFTGGLIDNWTVTGVWQVAAELGVGGSPALVDSVGDYTPSSNTYAQTALDLTSTEWPVLQIRDRHDLGIGDFGYIEVSTNNGSAWTTIYALRGTRTGWRDTRIDLSPFRESDSVWIRFRLTANSDTSVGDGWRMDHLAVIDHTPDTVSTFMEDFSGEPVTWIDSAWERHDSEPFAGSHALRNNSVGSSDGQTTLAYGKVINLMEVEDPVLTYWVRAQTSSSYSFAAQISTNGGVSWSTIPGTSFSNTTLPEWTHYQVDLSGHSEEPFRLRFLSDTSGWRSGTIEIDRIGLGGPAPGTPTLVSPGHNETVEVFRPVLTVANAIDYQNDPLNYQFEVYADSALSHLVAQVPTVASGSAQTSWQVDVNLTDNAPYWWRARAFEADNYGQWSSSGVFNVNETNTPPYPVVIAGPTNGAVFLDPNTRFFWYPTSDPDVGDTILDYHLQIARDDSFQMIVIDVAEMVVPESARDDLTVSIRLQDLAGAESLTEGTHYWRIRARDSRYSHSDWSGGFHWFDYPSRFDRWRYNEFTHREYLDNSVSGPLADANGDGIPNLLKFLYGTPPGETKPGEERPLAVIVEQEDQHFLGIEFNLRRDHLLHLQFEASIDATHWFPTLGAVETLEHLDADIDRVRFREFDPMTHDKRFIRLKVNTP